MRHVTHDSILGVTKRNWEEGSWVTQSTWKRKRKGKAAEWKSLQDLTDDRGQGGQDPHDKSKARLPEVQLTVVENGAYGQASETHTLLCNGHQSRPLHSPEKWTMANEVIEANE